MAELVTNDFILPSGSGSSPKLNPPGEVRISIVWCPRFSARRSRRGSLVTNLLTTDYPYLSTNLLKILIGKPGIFQAICVPKKDAPNARTVFRCVRGIAQGFRRLEIPCGPVNVPGSSLQV
jgi:hypothetical protein